MLKPAILYKYEIEKKSKELFYTDDYMYYIGYPWYRVISIPETSEDGFIAFASVDKDDNVVGYIAFKHNRIDNCADHFGLISFDKGNPILIRDLKAVVDMIMNKLKVHRMEWRCIEGNPVARHYEKFCKKHGGNILRLHDCLKDLSGKYHDVFIYEIIFPDN